MSDSSADRPFEDDHDLLTHSEAAGRLETEITALRTELSALRDLAAADSEAAARARTAERRLSLLLDAELRNSPAGAGRTSGFFAYRGPGKP